MYALSFSGLEIPPVALKHRQVRALHDPLILRQGDLTSPALQLYSYVRPPLSIGPVVVCGMVDGGRLLRRRLGNERCAPARFYAGCAGVAGFDSDALLTIHWIVTELDSVTYWGHTHVVPKTTQRHRDHFLGERVELALQSRGDSVREHRL